jgi:hypothetical protein
MPRYAFAIELIISSLHCGGQMRSMLICSRPDAFRVLLTMPPFRQPAAGQPGVVVVIVMQPTPPSSTVMS